MTQAVEPIPTFSDKELDIHMIVAASQAHSAGIHALQPVYVVEEVALGGAVVKFCARALGVRVLGAGATGVAVEEAIYLSVRSKLASSLRAAVVPSALVGTRSVSYFFRIVRVEGRAIQVSGFVKSGRNGTAGAVRLAVSQTSRESANILMDAFAVRAAILRILKESAPTLRRVRMELVGFDDATFLL